MARIRTKPGEPTKIQYKSDLIKRGTWLDVNRGSIAVMGMPVWVIQDTAVNNGLYILLTEDYTNLDNWFQVSSEAIGVDLTNYYTKTQSDDRYSPVEHAHTFDSLEDKPTTIEGFGITDAYTEQELLDTFSPLNHHHNDLYLGLPTWNQMFELVPNDGNPYIKAKLDFLGERGITAYATGSLGDIWASMPVATADSLGGVKVGESLIIEDGVLNINGDTFNLTNYYTKAQSDSLLSAKFDKTGGTISGNLTVTGNLSVLGTEFIADVQTVRITDNLAIINYGETGAGVTAGFSGWEIDRGTATHYRFGFTESVGYFQVGKVGDLQTVATREDVPLSNGFARWNATLKRFDTVVINNIVTGMGTAGQISFWNGTGSQAGSANLVWDNVNDRLGIGGTPSYDIYIQKSTPSIGLRSGKTNLALFGINDTEERISITSSFASGKFYPLTIRFAANEKFRFTPNGEFLIGKTTVTSGYKMDVNGAIRAAGNIYATGNITGAGEVTAYTASDARLKTNITSLNNINALDIINALNPVTYTWNSRAVQLNGSKNTTSINYGLIAQELEQIVPDLIRPIYGDYKTYDDRGLMTIMLQAIKELKAEVDLLKNKN